MALINTMVDTHGRFGRKNGKGFYDYPAKPAKKKLWPGLKDLYPQLEPEKVDVEELKQRLPGHHRAGSGAGDGGGHRHRSARGRCRLDPGLRLRALTGGALSYIDGIGAKKFVKIAKGLQKKYGASSRRRSCCSTWPRRAKPSTGASIPGRRRSETKKRPEANCHPGLPSDKPATAD